ncbi:6-phosphofructokinase [bacterium]|nr:6-phosphofructokinase [bacterium]
MTGPMQIGVLTSGGDSPGMNAALRAVVRSAIHKGHQVFGIRRGYVGLIEGGDLMVALQWSDVAGILQKGGTILGSARCQEFRQRPGRLKAAANMLACNLDRLVVIGGDGSLSGAQLLHEEWGGLLAELVESGQVTAELAARHPKLGVVGLPGSIDNDLPGIDVSIGSDTALHRIVEAVDRIFSTADSHQRIFIVEVMGRRCGYLALMSSLATGAEVAILPESPPGPGWENELCEKLACARSSGRKASIVLLAEGARDTQQNPITVSQVKSLLEERLHEEVRVTILGHVQRGGAPTAFDRNQSTILGAAAVDALEQVGDPVLIGLHGNRAVPRPLKDCLNRSLAIDQALAQGHEEQAVELRGPHFVKALQIRRNLGRILPGQSSDKPYRIAVMHAGAPAPGLNMAVRACVRLLVGQGHTVLGIRRGMKGLVEGDISELKWMDVSGWSSPGGAHLGTNRKVLTGHDLYAVARHLEHFQIQGLIIIGGMAAYETAETFRQQEAHYPSFSIPVICIPATIDNNLPGSDFAIGADTALNSIVSVVDRIKQSAVASRRCFVVEVMGRQCGYLALTSALATGAERVYLPEEGIEIERLLKDLRGFASGFQAGRRVGLAIRNECANPLYTTNFIASLFEEEGKDEFDVRQAILGHLQQGGDPTPFDRTLAVRLAAEACQKLLELCAEEQPQSLGVGLQGTWTSFTDLSELGHLLDPSRGRPKKQWWLPLRELMERLAHQE